MTEIAAASITKPTGLRKYLPILSWLPGYDRRWLRGDLIAGVTVVALLIPEGMAYAELAGMPPETAFYVAPIALILYAILGSSRQLVVVVSSVQAVMSVSIVGALAPVGSAEFIVLTAGLALMAGVVSVLAGLLRLGRIAQFFSASVLTGFVSGLAVVIAMKQLPKLFALEAGSGNVWQRFHHLVVHLPETHLTTLLVGLSCLVLMLLLERYFHRIPAALASLAFGIVVSTVFNLPAQGVHVVGDIPAGLVPPQLPAISANQWLALIPGGLALALVAFAESIGPSRSFASKYGYRVDANQELIGIGAANMGAGLFQGFPIGSSLSKSAANDAAGAKSQMSGIVAALLTVVVALFFTPLFRNLPEATLAAIVIVAIAGMFKWREMLRLYRLKKMDFALALITFLGVLTFAEALSALMLAVILSLVALVWRASKARLSVLGRERGRFTFTDMQQHPEALEIPGLLLVRPDEGLFFANVDTLREEIQDLVLTSQRPIRTVLLDLEMSNDLDVPSADQLRELHEGLVARQIKLMLSRVQPPVQRMLDRCGVTEQINAQHVYRRSLDGVVAHVSEQAADQQMIDEMMIDNLRRIQDLIDVNLPQRTGEDRARLEDLRQRLSESIDQLQGSDR